MTSIRIYIIYYLLLLIILGGCNNNDEIYNDELLRDVFKNCLEALINKDYNQFESAIVGDKNYSDDAVKAMFNQGTAVYEFENALCKIRGKNAVKEFYNIYVSPPFFPKMPPQDPCWINNIIFTPTKNKVRYYNPITNVTGYLIRANGTWKLQLKLHNPEYAIKDLNRNARIIRSGIKLLGNKNLSLKDIKEKMKSQYWEEVNKEGINGEESSSDKQATFMRSCSAVRPGR